MSKEIQVGNLKASWSDELEKDLREFHGIDVEKELIDILTHEMIKENDEQ